MNVYLISDSHFNHQNKMRIVRNSARCRKCGDEIESRTVHEFRFCKCGAIFVDGGKQYLRRGGDLDHIEETSIEESGDPLFDPTDTFPY